MDEQVAEFELTPEVIRQVTTHMNDDHLDDSLLICQELGDCPEAFAAEMQTMSTTDISFLVTTEEGEKLLTFDWEEPITSRPQIRAEVKKLYERAAAAIRS